MAARSRDPSPGPLRVTRRFVAAINRHDVDALAALMTPRHRFVDSRGAVVVGRERMRAGWRGYFAMFPDYRVSVRESAARGATVLLSGLAAGTYRAGRVPRRFSIPAAWRAVVNRGRVAEWQVFADNGPVRELLAAG